jgi:hypothetical protein
MKTRTRRRFGAVFLFVVIAFVAIVAEQVMTVLNYRSPFVTGWLLLPLIILLALYNVRKRLTFLLIGSSASWLQLHIYAALLTGVLFLLHIDWQMPTGTFERVLAAVYSGTFLSGVVGLFLSRAFPSRLRARGEEVLFERIPVYLKALRTEVEQLVFQCVEATETTAVPDLYLTHLKPFFERPRNAFWHLLHLHSPREKLLLQIRGQQRFLSDDEKSATEKITDLVRKKDDLDYQFALQGTLKLWLFIHIPLTYSLLVLAVFHLLAVYAYGGGN